MRPVKVINIKINHTIEVFQNFLKYLGNYDDDEDRPPGDL